LVDATARLKQIKGVGIFCLSGEDVIRHAVVGRILRAYNEEKK